MAECAICTRLAAEASIMPRGNSLRADVHPRRLPRTATVTMGDIGEEITEIELEPLPDEVPAEAPVEPVTAPAPV